MKIFHALIWLSIFFIMPPASSADESGLNPSPAPLYFTNATLVDVKGGGKRPGSTVVIKGDRFLSVSHTGEADLPSGAKTVNLAGKYIIPGLFDMHVHFADDSGNLLAFIANGITVVRCMGSVIIEPGGPDGFTYATREEMLDAILTARDKTSDGSMIGPLIVTPGVILSGPFPPDAPYSSPAFQWALTSAAEAVDAVRYLNERGVDFIKVHTLPSREVYFAVSEEAPRLGLTFAGHVPLSITAVEAVEAGQASIEHQTGTGEYMAMGDPAEADARRAELFGIYASHPDVRHVPTLAVMLGFARAAELYAHPENEPRLQYIRPELVAWWKKYWPPESIPAENQAASAALQEQITWVSEMNDRGIRILAGTDFGAAFVFPGFSLHDELVLLNQAGLSPFEALRAATLQPAVFLGLDKERGSIEAGKIADMVILDADPLADIANTQKISGVVLRGRYFDRAALDSILAGIRMDISRVSD